MSKPTLFVKKTDTFRQKIPLSVPNLLDGYISVDFPVMSPKEFEDFMKEDLTNDQQFDRIAVAVHGLPDDSLEIALEGQEALEAAKSGRFAMWIRPAIVLFFIEQFGEARVKNSQRSRGR